VLTTALDGPARCSSTCAPTQTAAPVADRAGLAPLGSAGLGILLPAAGTFLLTALPLPGFVDQNLVRLANADRALVLPPIVGLGGLFIADAGSRPRGLEAATQVLRGYPIAFLLALTIIFLGIVGVVRKGRNLACRRAEAHIRSWSTTVATRSWSPTSRWPWRGRPDGRAPTGSSGPRRARTADRTRGRRRRAGTRPRPVDDALFPHPRG